MTRPAGAVARASRGGELRALLRLAGPLVASHAGNHVMTLIDAAMLGRLGPEAIGGVGVGQGLAFAVMSIGIGIALGLDPLVSQAQGAGEHARARRLLWQGLRVAAIVAVPLAAALALAGRLVAYGGIDAAVAAQAHRYLLARIPTLLPLLAFLTARSYLQAYGLTRPIVLAMLLAIPVHALADALLIFGDEALTRAGLPPLGLPALGVAGPGLAAAIAFSASFGVLALAIRAQGAPADPARRRADAGLIRRTIGLGLPIGLQLLAEVGVFALVGLLIGRFGARAGGGHLIALSVAAFTFTVALGIAGATATRVGQAVGRGDRAGVRSAGLVGIATGSAFMAASAAVLLAAPRAIARLLTDDPGVADAAAALLAVAAVFQISDGIQAVGAGALRGLGDTRAPLRANVIGHFAVGLPVGIALGFGLHLGARGLWWGLCAGLTAVAGALVVRFLRLSVRPIGRA